MTDEVKRKPENLKSTMTVSPVAKTWDHPNDESITALGWAAKDALHVLDTWMHATPDFPSKWEINVGPTAQVIAVISLKDIRTLLILADPEGSYANTQDYLNLSQVAGLGASAAIAASVLAVATFPFSLIGFGVGYAVLFKAKQTKQAEMVRDAAQSWFIVEKFIAAFLEEIQRKVCGGKRGDGKLGTSITAAISALASWLVARFGLHNPVAYGLATAILITILGSMKQAFCKLTAQEYLAIVGFPAASEAVAEMMLAHKRRKRKRYISAENDPPASPA